MCSDGRGMFGWVLVGWFVLISKLQQQRKGRRGFWG